jgi:hypothetical protein
MHMVAVPATTAPHLEVSLAAQVATGPKTGLFIPVEGRMLYPEDGTLAVVRALVHGKGARAAIIITLPSAVAARYQGSQKLYHAERLDLPTWREVDESYAGEPRELEDPDEYVRIWQAWWFVQGRLAYEPDRTVMLRNGARPSMAALWECFLLVRQLALHASESQGAFEALGLAAKQRPYDASALAELRSVSPKLADLTLHRDNSLVTTVASMIDALLNIDAQAMVGPKVRLANPWPVQPRSAKR